MVWFSDYIMSSLLLSAKILATVHTYIYKNDLLLEILKLKNFYFHRVVTLESIFFILLSVPIFGSYSGFLVYFVNNYKI